jgi:hypothetical protein
MFVYKAVLVYRVTLLGESAGSASVTYHMLSELSMRELFLYTCRHAWGILHFFLSFFHLHFSG